MPDFDVNVKAFVSGVWQPVGGISVDGGNAFALKALMYGMNGSTPTILQVGSGGQLVSSPVARTLYAAKSNGTGAISGISRGVMYTGFPITDAISFTRIAGHCMAEFPFTLYVCQDESGTLDEENMKQSVITSYAEQVVGVSAREQWETLTGVGNITGTGNLSVVITAPGMVGSPLTIPVGVANGDTPTTWMNKIGTTLLSGAYSAVTDYFSLAWSANVMVFTRRVPADNQATLSIVVNAGTATNASLPNTSADSQAGVSGIATHWHASFDIELLKRYVQVRLLPTQDYGRLNFSAYLSTVVR